MRSDGVSHVLRALPTHPWEDTALTVKAIVPTRTNGCTTMEESGSSHCERALAHAHRNDPGFTRPFCRQLPATAPRGMPVTLCYDMILHSGVRPIVYRHAQAEAVHCERRSPILNQELAMLMKRRAETALVSALSLLLGLVVVVATPTAASAAEPVFRASVAANSTTTSASITVPAAVQSGDELIYIVTANTATTASTPSAWTMADCVRRAARMRSWVFTRTAASNTAGSTVAVTMGASSKVSRVLLAYSGAASPTIVTNAVQAGTSASLTTPGAAVDVAKSTVVSLGRQTERQHGVGPAPLRHQSADIRRLGIWSDHSCSR